MPEPVAFLFPAFPNLHQTFVLWEVIALREAGVEIELFSIKKPLTKTQQPEAEELQKEVQYLPSPFSGAVLAANLKVLMRHPLRYLGTYVAVLRGWWADRSAGRDYRSRTTSSDSPDRQRTLREHLEGRYNRSPAMYLLKSFALVPIGVYFGAELERRGIRRVHSHWASYSTTVAYVAHRVYGIPFSFTAHAYDIYLVPRLLGVKVREAEFAVTCGKVNRAFLQNLAGEGQGRVIVNYHGVNLDRFRPVERSPRRGGATIVTCGRLEPYKGHHVLLRAFAELDGDARCVVVGEGPQRRRLEELARELGIADRVEFTGPVPQTKLAEIYAEADVFVLASVILEESGKRDVIPNVLAEAMAMRIPVVATDVSGISELVEDGVSGRLVAPNDPQALAGAIEELLSDATRRERIAAGGVEKVAREFDRSVNIKELAELFLGGRDGTLPG